ncbi:MAG: DNA gyrase inhibitor YacG [Nitrospiraceae bacterium]|nr:DNA gyrase inhibitor YacG [Nitrospiraceae bacterium]
MTEKKEHRCPWCGRPTCFEGNPYRPFCSKRCKMADLDAWFRGEYRISNPIWPEDADYAEGHEKNIDPQIRQNNTKRH